MNTRLITWLGIAAVLAQLRCPAQDPINRLACTVLDPVTFGTKLAFTDTETGSVTTFPLPSGIVPATGFIPNHLIAMDRHGDVWLGDRNSNLLRKFSARTGALLASALPQAQPSYMVTDQQGNLLVGSWDPMGGPGGVYLQRFTMSGTLLATVPIPSLFPSGVFFNPWGLFNRGIPRMLVARDGSIWLIVPAAAYDPVIKLNSNLTRAASYGLYSPLSILPDSDSGVWVLFDNQIVAAQVPGVGPLMPGALPRGWVHLSSTGAILESSIDMNAAGNYAPSFGHIRFDGRQFQYPDAASGSLLPPHIWVHQPMGPPLPWYTFADRVSFPGPSAYLMGFHLDGAQRVWALRYSWPQSVTDYARTRWERYSIEPPYGNPLVADVGETFRPYPNAAQYMIWSSYWGNASLFEYVFYTDPYGDLDGDGVPNQVELSTFSNALLPNNFSPAVTATSTGQGPGFGFSVSYRVLGDAGLAYAAPFAMSQATYSLGGGWFLPVLPQDPLVGLSLQPLAPGFSGTVGVLDANARATATVQVPNNPSLSGFSLYSCIVTVAPNLPIPFKTVSPPFEFTIP